MRSTETSREETNLRERILHYNLDEAKALAQSAEYQKLYWKNLSEIAEYKLQLLRSADPSYLLTKLEGNTP